MNAYITIFSYRLHGGPKGNVVVDCRGLQNPGKGASRKKVEGLAKLPLFNKLVDNVVEKAVEHGEVEVGCEWGRHRSRFVAEKATDKLVKLGYTVGVMWLAGNTESEYKP